MMHISCTIDAENLGVKISTSMMSLQREKRSDPLGLADDIRLDFICESHQF